MTVYLLMTNCHSFFVFFTLLLYSEYFNFAFALVIILFIILTASCICRKLLMRWTVLSSDALIFFPAVVYFVVVYYKQSSRSRKSDMAWHITMLLLNPCLILIDHGHFQVSENVFMFIAFGSYFSVTGLGVP